MGALLWVLVGAVVFAECVTSTAVPGVVRFAVIAPLETSSKNDETLGAILPSVDLAAQAIAQPKGSLPGWKILIDSRNGNCSSTDGPLAAFDLHTNSDLFLGPVCDYVIAPVARYAGVWKIPVLTAGGLAENFNNREEYPTLTRMMGSYKLVGDAFRHILHGFGWNVVGMLYYNYGLNALQMGNSKCYFTLSAVFIALGMKPMYKSFNDTDSRESFKELLTEMSHNARSECRPGLIRVVAVAAVIVVAGHRQ
ncbi:atrial natriuretic peptide receptor 1 isoform X2 [Acyrthosiphon pisum]|uniref:Receptor ligand binding region domain-containing protein n=1 Tax=Acyrthosiphon pisum TaxID=7029 RepID=A0A8R2JNN8_ACYPI|nr:atrial natriuretic peptide receptor 1 isoform X2 [Acyrthosiphon pisum]